MKCKVCGGTGTSNTCVNGTFKPCTFCDGTGEYEPFDLDVELDKLYPTEQTNEEWLRQATTEQLAEWICSVHEKCYYCGAKRISDRERCPFGDGKCRNNKHEFAMWLKQPHAKKE